MMRKFIDTVEQLNEKMLFLEKKDGWDCAIDPTRLEWERNFSRNGAAGVLLKDGRVLVGDDTCLDHLSLMDRAGIDSNNERARLQIYNGRVVIELWDELEVNGMEWDSPRHPTPEEIEARTKYPEEVRATLALDVRHATSRFVPGWEIIVELKSGIAGEDWLEEEY